ncbi:hypothetical protein [Gramella sp. KN1008]|uniref:hypothetical protein n=1 Tax=Gramella sp. KN1008 TaxID=2529298 RepID=UPI0010404C71|nr:hypothetical protein [Gramella sp. KN1008]TBW29955.1 hypothetical protein EZJ28_00695 [Gramella sp. KN1008]
MKKAFIVIFVTLCLSCSSDNSGTISIGEGKWVEIETKSDTLSFSSLGGMDIMTLARGEELQEGVLKPKYRSGRYEYGISEGKISLRWLLSSNSQFEEYSFRIEDEIMYIGNFYASSSGEILTFKKLD